MALHPISFQASLKMTIQGKDLVLVRKSTPFAQSLDHVVDDAVAGGQEGQQDAVHDDPGEEVRQVGQRLHHPAQVPPAALIDGDGQQNGEREAEDQLAEAVHQRVAQEFDKVVGADEGTEVLKTYPRTAQHPVEGPVILERDLTVEDRHILEDDVVGQGNDEQQVYRTVSLDLSEQHG